MICKTEKYDLLCPVARRQRDNGFASKTDLMRLRDKDFSG